MAVHDAAVRRTALTGNPRQAFQMLLEAEAGQQPCTFQTQVILLESLIAAEDFSSAGALLSKVTFSRPLQDQFNIRLGLSRGLYEIHVASQSQGIAAIGCCLRAAATAVHAMEEATRLRSETDRIALMYNSSVLHWFAVRPLFRQSAHALAIPTLGRVVQMLGGIQDKSGAAGDLDVHWVARNTLALAWAQQASGNTDAAASSLQTASALAEAASSSVSAALRAEVQCTHMLVTGTQPAHDSASIADVEASHRLSSEECLTMLHRLQSLQLQHSNEVARVAAVPTDGTDATSGSSTPASKKKGQSASSASLPHSAGSASELEGTLVDMLMRVDPVAAQNYLALTDKPAAQRFMDEQVAAAQQAVRESHASSSATSTPRGKGKASKKAGKSPAASSAPSSPTPAEAAAEREIADEGHARVQAMGPQHLLVHLAYTAALHSLLDLASVVLQRLTQGTALPPTLRVIADITESIVLAEHMNPSIALQQQQRISSGAVPAAASALLSSADASLGDMVAASDAEHTRQDAHYKKGACRSIDDGEGSGLLHVPFQRRLAPDATRQVWLLRQADAVGAAERAVQTAQRSGSGPLMETAAVHAFNTCVPLLRAGHGSLVLRCLGGCASALAACASGLTALRARCHSVLSHLELQAGQVSKAAEHAASALALDYADTAAVVNNVAVNRRNGVGTGDTTGLLTKHGAEPIMDGALTVYGMQAAGDAAPPAAAATAPSPARSPASTARSSSSKKKASSSKHRGEATTDITNDTYAVLQRLAEAAAEGNFPNEYPGSDALQLVADVAQAAKGKSPAPKQTKNKQTEGTASEHKASSAGVVPPSARSVPLSSRRPSARGDALQADDQDSKSTSSSESTDETLEQKQSGDLQLETLSPAANNALSQLLGVHRAMGHITRTQLDSQGEAAQDRFLDRYLLPLSKDLQLTTAVYDEPDGDFECASAALLQAEAATSSNGAVPELHKAARHLGQCAAALADPPGSASLALLCGGQVEDATAGEGNTDGDAGAPEDSAVLLDLKVPLFNASNLPDGAAGGVPLRRLHGAWSRLAALASKHGALDIARRACRVLLGVKWDPEAHRVMVHAQAMACLHSMDATVQLFPHVHAVGTDATIVRGTAGGSSSLPSTAAVQTLRRKGGSIGLHAATLRVSPIAVISEVGAQRSRRRLGVSHAAASRPGTSAMLEEAPVEQSVLQDQCFDGIGRLSFTAAADVMRGLSTLGPAPDAAVWRAQAVARSVLPGFDIPGCPASVAACKEALCFACINACRLGTAIGRADIVHNACAKLWNSHKHVWKGASPERCVAEAASHTANNELEADAVLLAAGAGLGDARYGATYAAGHQLSMHLRQALAVCCTALMATGCQDTQLLGCLVGAAAGACEAAAAAEAAVGHKAGVQDELNRGLAIVTAPFRRLAASPVWRGAPGQRTDGAFLGVLPSSAPTGHPAELPTDLRMPHPGAYSAAQGFLPTPLPRPAVALPLLLLAARLQLRLLLLDSPSSPVGLTDLLSSVKPLTVTLCSQLAAHGAVEADAGVAASDGGSPQLFTLAAALTVLTCATGSRASAFVDCGSGPGASLAQPSSGLVAPSSSIQAAHSSSVPGGLPLAVSLEVKRDALTQALAAMQPAAIELGLKAAEGRLESLGIPTPPANLEGGAAAAAGAGAKKSTSPSAKKSARDTARSKGAGSKSDPADSDSCVQVLATALESLALAALNAGVPGSDAAALKALFAAGAAAGGSGKNSRSASFKGQSSSGGGDSGDTTQLSQAVVAVRQAIAVRLRMSSTAVPAGIVAQADSPDSVLPPADFAQALAWACDWSDQALGVMAQLWASLAQSACDVWSLRASQRAAAAALAFVPAEPARQQQLGRSTHGKAYRWFAAAGMTWGRAIAAMVSHRAAVAAATSVLRDAEDRGEISLGSATATSTPRGKGKKGGSKSTDTAAASASSVDATALTRSTEDALRLLALSKLCIGMHWAAAARAGHLAVSGAVQALAVATPLMGNPVTRAALRPHLSNLTASLCRVFASQGGSRTGKPLAMDAAAASVAGDLFRALLVCHADIADWSGGLSVAEEAFAMLPSSQHSKLWPSRVVFQARLGLDVAHGLQQLRVQLQKQQQGGDAGKAGVAGKSDPTLLGRLWLSLARASSSPGDQLSALSASLEVTQGMFARVYACFALAEWCTRQRLPMSDARDALHSAADILLEVVQPSAGKSRDVVAGDASDDGESSMWGGSTVLSRSQHSKAGGASPSSAGRSVRSGVRPPPSRRSNRTGSDVVSVVGSEDAAGTSNGDWPSQPTIQHVDMLVRAFTQLASIAPSASQRRQYALRATYFVQMAWGMAVAASNRVAAEAAFVALPQEQQAAVHDAAGGYDWWVEERVASCTPFSVPNDPAGWIALAGAVACHPWWGALPGSTYVPPSPEGDVEGGKGGNTAVQLPETYGHFPVPYPTVSQGEGWVFFVEQGMVPDSLFSSTTPPSGGKGGTDGQSTTKSSMAASSAMRSSAPSQSTQGPRGAPTDGSLPTPLPCGESTRTAARHAALLCSWRAPESTQQPYMLCQAALGQPALSLSCLVQLAQALVADGEYEAASPVLLLAMHIADSLVGHRMNSSFMDLASISALLRVLLLQWCDAMGMHLPAALLRRALGLDSGRAGSNDALGAGNVDLSMTPAAATAAAVMASSSSAAGQDGVKSTSSTPRKSEGAAGGQGPTSLALPSGLQLKLKLAEPAPSSSSAELAARIAACSVLSACAPLVSGGIGSGPPKEELVAFEGEVALWEEAQAAGGIAATQSQSPVVDEIMGVPAVQLRAVSSTSAELDIHQVWLDLALAAAGGGSLDGALRWLEPAERHARAFNDPDMLARAQLVRASVYFHRGSALEAAECATQALAGFAVYSEAPQGHLESASEELLTASAASGTSAPVNKPGVRLSSLGSAPVSLWEAGCSLLADALAWGSHKGDALPLLLASAQAAEQASRPHVLDMPQIMETVQEAARSKAKAAKNLASMVAIGAAAGIALATKAARMQAAKAAAKEAADMQARVRAPKLLLLRGPLAELNSMQADAVALATGHLDARHAASSLLRSAAEAGAPSAAGQAASEAIHSEMARRVERAVQKCLSVSPVPRAPPSHRHRHAPIPTSLTEKGSASAGKNASVSGGHISLPAVEAAVRSHTAVGVALTSAALSVRQANSDAWREEWTQAALHFMRAIALGHTFGLRAPLIAACAAFAQALVAVPGGEPAWWDDLQLPDTPVSQAQLSAAHSDLSAVLVAAPYRPSQKWTAVLHSPTAPQHDLTSAPLAKLLLAHQHLRIAVVRDAVGVLRFAFDSVCQPWQASCAGGGLGDTTPYISPAQQAMSAVQCMLVDTLVLASTAEARPALLAERVLLHGVQSDPVAMYLHSQGGSAQEIAESKETQESKGDAPLPPVKVHAAFLQEALVHGHALLAASDGNTGLRAAALLRLGLASAAAANNHTEAAALIADTASDADAADLAGLLVLTAPPTSTGGPTVARLTLADMLWWPRQAAAAAPVRVKVTPAPDQETADVPPAAAKGKKSPRGGAKAKDADAVDEPDMLLIDANDGTHDLQLVHPPAWADPLSLAAGGAASMPQPGDGKTKVAPRSKTPPKGSGRGASASVSPDEDAAAAAAQAASAAAAGSAGVLLGALTKLGVPWVNQWKALLASSPTNIIDGSADWGIVQQLQLSSEAAESAAVASAAAASRPSSAKGGKGGKKSSKSPRSGSGTASGAGEVEHEEDPYRLAAPRVPLCVDVAGVCEHGPQLPESMQVLHPAAIGDIHAPQPHELRRAVASAIEAALNASSQEVPAAEGGGAQASDADAPQASLASLPRAALEHAAQEVVSHALGTTLPGASVSIPRSLIEHHARAAAALHAAVAMGTATCDWATVGVAAYHLVELYGTFAPCHASAALSLYQSVAVRSRLLQLLVEAGRDADVKTAQLARGTISDDLVGGGEGAGELVLMLRSLLAAEAAHAQGLLQGGHVAGVGGLHGNLGSGYAHSSGGLAAASASSCHVSGSVGSLQSPLGIAAGDGVHGVGAQVGTMLLATAGSDTPLSHPQYRRIVAELSRTCLAYQLLDCSRPWHSCLAALPAGHRLCVLHLTPAADAIIVSVSWRVPVNGARPSAADASSGGACDMAVRSVTHRCSLSPEATAAAVRLLRDIVDYRRSSSIALAELEGCQPGQGGAWLDYEAVSPVSPTDAQSVQAGPFTVDCPPSNPLSNTSSTASGCIVHPSTGQVLQVDDHASAALASTGAGFPPQGCLAQCAELPPSSPQEATIGTDTVSVDFQQLLARTEALLAPVFSSGVRCALAGAAPVMLCVDPSLEALPLEALQVLQSASSVTRELSAQFMGNRAAAMATALHPDALRPQLHMLPVGLQSGQVPVEAPSNGPFALDGPVPLQRNRCVHVIDPLADDFTPGSWPGEDESAARPPSAASDSKASKKASPKRAGASSGKAKKGAKEEQPAEVPPVVLLPPVSGPASRHSTTAQYNALVKPILPKPIGTDARKPAPSSQQWLGLLTRGELIDSTDSSTTEVGTDVGGDGGDASEGSRPRSTLLYSGPTPFLQVLQPELLVGLDARVTGLVVLAGGSSTDAAFRRSARLRNAQSAARQDLASPYATAALLSLTGIGGVALNSWGCTVSSSMTMLRAVVQPTPTGPAAAPATQANEAGHLQDTEQSFSASSQYISIGRTLRSAASTPVVPAQHDCTIVPKPRVRSAMTYYGLPTVHFKA